MSGTMKFNGYMKVRIGEAVGLQPTRWSLRHSLFKKGHQLLDPYIAVSVDQVRVGQTSTKQKTNKPTYNEEFSTAVTDGCQLELAVFHGTPIGYDDFVANCTVRFHDLLHGPGSSDSFEGWVSGRSLSWHMVQHTAVQGAPARACAQVPAVGIECFGDLPMDFLWVLLGKQHLGHWLANYRDIKNG
uniref:C2 domain-containing protein n=1 Tax=Varanus komodoensis TaxID=61221 RepID=A0A8D2KQN8_VARKO